MKIENKEVSIKIGDKTKILKNLILNSYLDLFADSLINFKNKDLPYCLVNFTKHNNIDETSTIMEYDTILEADYSNNIELLTENTLINKYYYMDTVNGEKSLQEFSGLAIKELGFANYDNQKNMFVLYAFLDVSKYDLYIQDNQPIIISRIDKITNDLKMYSNSSKVKGPIHLTMRGIAETKGMEYDVVMPKLHSIGLGTLYNKMEEEILIKDLDIEKKNTGQVEIYSAKDRAVYPSAKLYPSNNFFPGRKKIGLKELKIEEKEEGTYPSIFLYPNTNIFMSETRRRWIIYKFKLYKIKTEGLKEILEDTGDYYYQSKLANMYGKLKLKVKYERS